MFVLQCDPAPLNMQELQIIVEATVVGCLCVFVWAAYKEYCIT